MRTSSRLVFLAALWTLPALAAPAAPPAAPAAPAARPDLVTIIDRVQKRYDGTQDFRSRFEQVQLNAAFGRTTRSAGEVLFKKPGRMRWDYDKPEKKTFVSNGQVLWLYEPEDQQAFRQDLKASQLPAALAFLMGKGKLTDEFDVSFANDAPYGRPGDHRLSLKPKQPQGRYKAIYFIADPQTFHIRETVLIDAQGNVNDVTFLDPKINTKVADATFRWSPPAGVKVVDTSKLQR